MNAYSTMPTPGQIPGNLRPRHFPVGENQIGGDVLGHHSGAGAPPHAGQPLRMGGRGFEGGGGGPPMGGSPMPSPSDGGWGVEGGQGGYSGSMGGGGAYHGGMGAGGFVGPGQQPRNDGIFPEEGGRQDMPMPQGIMQLLQMLQSGGGQGGGNALYRALASLLTG